MNEVHELTVLYINLDVSIDNYLPFKRPSEEKQAYFRREIMTMSGAGRGNNMLAER